MPDSKKGTLDLSQFYQTFYDESLELLQEVESILVDVDLESMDDEQINTIFRAMHSIKGSSATFGFTPISQFTHHAETYLDLVRNKERTLTTDAVDTLLQSVDCIRVMIDTLKQEKTIDESPSKKLETAFQDLIKASANPKKTTEKKPAMEGLDPFEFDDLFDSKPTSSNEKPKAWHIYFKPDPNFLSVGNEPLRMFRELGKLGECTVKACLDELPVFEKLKLDKSYLSWEIEVAGPSSEQEIKDAAFEWVLDDCKLTIEPLDSISSSASSKKSESVTEEIEESAESLQKNQEHKESDIKSTEPVNLKETASIRVSTEKVDALINLAGELVITQSILGQLRDAPELQHIGRLKEGLDQLEHYSRELQDSVMRIRMLPIKSIFSRFPRMVRDLSKKMEKKIQLKMLGESTELDKNVLEKVTDPLVHLIRNSIDHGIEKPDLRRLNNKPETGTLQLNAYHQGGNVIIEVSDDGAGLQKDKILEKAVLKGIVTKEDNLTDDQINLLIFQPGFSTAEVVTDLSGRGVGMDVVRKNIQQLGGTIDIRTKMGEGTIFTIRLPLTLAIIDGQLVGVGDQTCVISLVSMVEIIQIQPKLIKKVGSATEVYYLRNKYIPMIRLYDYFGFAHANIENHFLVIVEVEGQHYGLVVDDLFSQQQVVIKSLEENYDRITGIAGATILGDGKVALIMDVAGLVRMASHKDRQLKKYNPLLKNAAGVES